MDRNFICHNLNVNPFVTPKKKPPLRSSRDHSDVVKDEVTKFKQAGAIKEVFYPEWLANTDSQEKEWEMASICGFHRFKCLSRIPSSIEVYIDDMVVKSKIVSEHVIDLGNIFETLRKHKLHLNTSKCFFDVESGKFLGYMVTRHGIEVNPDQIKAINSLQPPRNPK